MPLIDPERSPQLPAEHEYLTKLAAGSVEGSGCVVIGDGTLPSVDADERRIRSTFILALLTNRVRGVQIGNLGLMIAGALIVEELDLRRVSTLPPIGLFACRLVESVVMVGCRARSLVIDSSDVREIIADRADIDGPAFFKHSTCRGELRFAGCRISGDLNLCNSNYMHELAIQADSCRVDGNVFLSGAVVNGRASFLGASVAGSLHLDDISLRPPRGRLYADRVNVHGSLFLRSATIGADVRIVAARIGSNLELSGSRIAEGSTIAVTGATIDRDLVMRDVQFGGTLILSGVDVRGVISDTPNAWPEKGGLFLDSFTYRSFGLTSPNTARQRLPWLDRQLPFAPDSYEQLAITLRRMGKDSDAKEVLFEKELRRRSHERARANAWKRLHLAVSDAVFRYTIGFGLRPFRAAIWLIVLWLVGAATFSVAYRSGGFKPNAANTLRSDDWVLSGVDDHVLVPSRRDVGRRSDEHQTQLEVFLGHPGAASYPAFSALVYSLDALVPLVDLELQDYWIPDENVGRAGFVARCYLWVHILFGWALSLLAVAGFSGLVRSD